MNSLIRVEYEEKKIENYIFLLEEGCIVIVYVVLFVIIVS